MVKKLSLRQQKRSSNRRSMLEKALFNVASQLGEARFSI
jgi:hypothetical protein